MNRDFESFHRHYFKGMRHWAGPLSIVMGIFGFLVATVLGLSSASAEPASGVSSHAGFNFEQWETLPIQEGGLEKSLYTFARETVREVTGSANFGGRGPMENMFSMAFEPERWLHEPTLKVRHAKLKKIFGGQTSISLLDLESKRPEWMPLAEGEKKDDEVSTEIHNLISKANLLAAPATALAIVPTQNFRGQKDLWLTIDALNEKTKTKTVAEQKLIDSWTETRAAFLGGDAGRFNEASRRSIEAINELGVSTFKPAWKFKLDRWDSHVGLFRLAGWTYLLAAMIFLVSYLAGRSFVSVLATSTLSLGVGLHITALVVRGLLAGRTPVANLFESAVFLIGVMTIASVIISIYYKTRIAGLAGATLGAFFMGMANNIPLQYGRKILPLIDALQSYWLHIHVTSMLTSYALFALAFFIAAAYLARSWTLGRRASTIEGGLAADPMLNYLDGLNFRIITIGFPVLTAGVILGAVWASEAWGRPWAFDPKETAAAITWMIYAIYLHARLFLGWKGPKGIWLSVLGFGAVVFTYLGVSFFLPGLHSYVSSGEVSFLGTIKKLIPGL